MTTVRQVGHPMPLDSRFRGMTTVKSPSFRRKPESSQRLEVLRSKLTITKAEDEHDDEDDVLLRSQHSVLSTNHLPTPS